MKIFKLSKCTYADSQIKILKIQSLIKILTIYMYM